MVIQETLQEDTMGQIQTKGLVETQEHLTSFPMAVESMILLAMYDIMLWLIVAILCSTIFQTMAEQAGEDESSHQLSQT